MRVMHSHRPFLNQHRLRRLALWTLAVLSWIAAMLFSDRAVSLRHIQQRTGFISLAWLTDLVGKLLIARAAQLARLRRRKRRVYWRHGRDLHRPHIIRSVLGARLRRALKHRDIAAWIANLTAVLRNLDAYAAPLAKRLRRGLTRLWRIVPPIAPAMPLLGPPAPTPAFSDSS
jgi:hypothetical protein